MNRYPPILLFAILLGFVQGTLTALAHAQDGIAAAERAYSDRRYDQALSHLSNLPGLLEIVPFLDRLKGEERERILFDLARCRAAIGDSIGSGLVLNELFRNDPKQARGAMEVDKDPYLKTVLDEMRIRRRQHQQAKISSTSVLKAAVRSIIIPGWGQRYRGRTQRGNLISAAAGAFVIGWSITDRSYRSALDTYRRTSELDLMLATRTGGPDDPTPFADRFAKVDSRASTARAMGIALVSVWVYSVTENFLIQPGKVALAFPLD